MLVIRNDYGFCIQCSEHFCIVFTQKTKFISFLRHSNFIVQKFLKTCYIETAI